MGSPRSLGKADPIRRRLAVVIGVWLASAVAATLYAMWLMTPQTRDHLQRFWATGFIPATVAGFVRTWRPWDQRRPR